MLGSDYVKIAAVIGITVIVCVGVYLGHDGALIGIGTAIIGGIAGYELKAKISK